jgi:hypothetical protein
MARKSKVQCIGFLEHVTSIQLQAKQGLKFFFLLENTSCMLWSVDRGAPPGMVRVVSFVDKENGA